MPLGSEIPRDSGSKVDTTYIAAGGYDTGGSADGGSADGGSKNGKTGDPN